MLGNYFFFENSKSFGYRVRKGENSNFHHISVNTYASVSKLFSVARSSHGTHFVNLHEGSIYHRSAARWVKSDRMRSKVVGFPIYLVLIRFEKFKKLKAST